MVAESLINFDEDVVISGVGGNFPRAGNLEEFKKVLLSNEILLGSRWKEGERNVSNKLGVISGVEFFDSTFFGIHRHQASFMDPMQRVIMEQTFEALVDAGVNPQDVRGRRIGVFIGSSVGENDNLFYESVVSGFGVTGHSRAMMANRISYWLNLKGPSCAYDSNWNGGAEVLSMAVDAVRSGLCEAAIIGTANITLNSEISWHYNDLGLLSPDGSTKAYDADACGYARADGCIAMYIQRASDAKRSYASVIHASTMFNGGRDGTLMDLSLDGMTNFIDNFYKQCGMHPAEVEFVEAYGCGIKETDEIELKAIEKVYCKNRKTPLLIGSVKTQTGHSEASANLMSIAKVLVAFETGIIPANVQYLNPNPNIPGLFNGNLEVITKNRKFTGQYAACHGIGLSSSYSHVLLRRNPKPKEIEVDDLPRLVVASTRNETGIQELLKTIRSQADNTDPEYVALVQELFSKTISGHLYRGYTILNKTGSEKQEFERYPGNKRPVWFIYSGMGSQWPRMACDLMKLPIFAESIMKSHQTMLPRGIDLLQIITTEDPKIFDNILHSFVGIAAIQIALTDILKAIGIVPDGIIGHSVGELGCAYADDCLTAEQMILCAYSRGKASIEAELIRGMMAAIGRGYKQIKDEVPPSIEVACHNAADSCTLSGPTADMEVYVKSLQNKNIFARLVNVSNIAYHSKYIKPAAPGLLNYLKEVIPVPKRRSSKWVSTSVLEDQWDAEMAKYCSAEYHTNNLLSSVYFEEGSRHIPKDAIAIEIAPHGLLQAILKRSLKGECTNIPLTLRSSKDPLEFLLGAFGKMYLTGIDMNLTAIYPPINYPVSRSTMGLSPLVHWEHSERWRTGIEDKMNYLVSMKETQVTLNSDEFRQYAGHELDDSIVLPISAYLTILLEILTIRASAEVKHVIFEEIKFKSFLVIPKIGSVPLYAMLQNGSGSFEILSGDKIICTGRVSIPEPTDEIRANVNELTVTEQTMYLSAKDIYSEFVHRGHKYSRHFKPIKDLKLNEKGSISTINWDGHWQSLVEGMFQQVMLKHGEKYQNVLVPSFVQKIILSMQDFPSEPNTDLMTTFNYATQIASTGCVQVIGAQTRALKQNSKPLNYHLLEFVSFSNGTYENLEIGINNSIKLVLENFDDPLINNIEIIEAESNNPSLWENINNVVVKNPDLSVNLTAVKDNKVAILSQNTPVLIITNQEINDELAKVVQSSRAFLLLRSDKNLLNYSKIVEVLHFKTSGIAYSLLRKSFEGSPIIVRITGDVLSIKDLEKNLPWVLNLKSLVSKPTASPIMLVSPVAPTEGVVNFVKSIKSTTEFQNVMSLFLLDKRAPEFNPTSDTYRYLFRKGLSTNVLKDGIFGSYLTVPVDLKENIRSPQTSVSTLVTNKSLEFIGINADDETLVAEPHEVGLGNIDYSGINNSNQKIMGLAKFSTDAYDLVPDSVLVWNLPENWTMEDGCSIPHAYTTAYHCLVQKARLKHGETVLIHNAGSAIGLASISIAVSYGCTVFVTVATNKQRSYIKNLFSTLRDRNILDGGTTSFELHLLMATGGVGAHVILNCLPKSLLNASIRCLAEFGRFVQLGKYDVNEHNSIGMRVFLKNTSFIGVVPEEIFDGAIEEKQQLHALVQQGLKTFAVRPIRRVIVEHDDVRSILGNLTKSDNMGKILIKVTPSLTINYLNVDKPNQFICDVKNSYLVYGGTSEAWADVVEWLVVRGARKIVVSSDHKPQQAHVNRRLNLLRSYFNANVIYQPNKVQNRDSNIELVSEVYSLGPIHAVFVLPGKNSPRSSEMKSIQYLDAALRTAAPKAIFINLSPSAAGIGQQRSDAGYAAYNIQWPTSLEFPDALFGLDEILMLKAKNIIIKSEKGDSTQETAQVLYKKLTLTLPQSSNDLLAYHKWSSQNPRFEQVLTSGPHAIREVPPVFIIPGLYNISNVIDMCKDLLHPTFVAQLPTSKMKLGEIASLLAEEMKTIFPKGHFNLIGVSWGGILAIEIGKILQRQFNVQVTFVDGAPDTFQAIVNNLGNDASVEVNVLSRILNITSTEVLKKLNALSDWNSRLEVALSNYDGNEEDLPLVQNALDVLLERIYAAVSYSPDEEPIKGEVFLIRPSGSNKYDNCNLNKYSIQTTQIYVLSGDHISMLHHKEFVDTINDNVAVR